MSYRASAHFTFAGILRAQTKITILGKETKRKNAQSLSRLSSSSMTQENTFLRIENLPTACSHYSLL